MTSFPSSDEIHEYIHEWRKTCHIHIPHKHLNFLYILSKFANSKGICTFGIVWHHSMRMNLHKLFIPTLKVSRTYALLCVGITVDTEQQSS